MTSGQSLDFEAVRRFCTSRPVELAIARGGRSGDGLTLHADFEGYADFFVIEADDVEYVELPGRCWVGGLHLGDWAEVSARKSKWGVLRTECSGTALAFWDDDAKDIADAPEPRCYVIVAGRFTFRGGKDWSQPVEA